MWVFVEASVEVEATGVSKEDTIATAKITAEKALRDDWNTCAIGLARAARDTLKPVVKSIVATAKFGDNDPEVLVKYNG